jgi:hypothetical protein
VTVRVGQDQVQRGGVLQDDVVEDLDRRLRELDHLVADSDELLLLLLRHPLRHPSRKGGDGMDGLAPDDLDDALPARPLLDHLRPQLEAHLLHHAQDVPLGLRGVGTHDEVRAPESVEVRRVVSREEAVVEELPQLEGRRRRRDTVDGVGRLHRRHVVGLGAHAADPRRDPRHLLDRPPLAEHLEPPQLRHLEVAVGEVPVVVHEQVDLPVPFQPGDRVDRDRPGAHGCLLRSVELGSVKR